MRAGAGAVSRAHDGAGTGARAVRAPRASLHARAARRRPDARSGRAAGAAGRASRAGEPPSPLDPPSGCVYRTRCPHARRACAASACRPGRTPGASHQVACHRCRELPLVAAARRASRLGRARCAALAPAIAAILRRHENRTHHPPEREPAPRPLRDPRPPGPPRPRARAPGLRDHLAQHRQPAAPSASARPRPCAWR